MISNELTTLFGLDFAVDVVDIKFDGVTILNQNHKTTKIQSHTCVCSRKSEQKNSVNS